MSNEQYPSGSQPSKDGTSDKSGAAYSQPYVAPTSAPSQPQQPYAPAQYPVQQPYPGPYAGYAYPLVLPDHPNGTPSMVLGILSLVFCGVTSPFGLRMALKGRKEVAANPGVYRDGGMLTAGLVLNIIGLVYLAGMALYLIMMIVIYGSIIGVILASGHS